MCKRVMMIRVLKVLTMLLAIPLLLLASCQHKLIYFPRAYSAGHEQRWQKVTQGKVLSFTTSAGKQQAYLLHPRTGAKPERLWLVCGGNGSLATDWTDFLRHDAPPQDAYLLIDYPGYGSNEGAPSPSKILETIRAALPLAAAEFSWEDASLPQRTRILGLSLGCAAALSGAEAFGLNRGVLLAPFTSTMDMAKEVTGMNLGFLVWHRFDNRHILQQIAGAPEARFEIFHGLRDTVVPFAMSQQLQQLHPDHIHLQLIENGGHYLLGTCAAEIVEAMLRVR